MEIIRPVGLACGNFLFMYLKPPTVGTYELAAIGIAMAERDLAL